MNTRIRWGDREVLFFFVRKNDVPQQVNKNIINQNLKHEPHDELDYTLVYCSHAEHETT